jgi:type II secretory pathway component PulF
VSQSAFRYRAATPAGEVVEGIVQATSSREALDALRRQTLVPVSVEPVGTGARTVRPSRRGRREAVATSTRTLATLVGAGLPLDRALHFAASHVAHAEVREAFTAMLLGVREGAALSEAMRRTGIFGPFAAAVVRAGEESGTLDDALGRLAEHYERTNELASQVRSALLYPALMGVVAGIGVIVLLAFVVPRFVSMLGDVGGTLPWSTRVLVAASHALIGGWWLWLPAVALVVLATRTWLSQPGNRARWHAWRLGLPVSGPLEWSLATARYTRALAVLLRGGAPALSSLRSARGAVTNDALGARLEEAAVAVGRGETISGALSSALPPLAIQLMAAGEESGTLDEMCARVADTYDGEVARGLRTLVRLVEPVLIIAFGVIVGFIALAMLQAVYGVNAGLT